MVLVLQSEEKFSEETDERKSIQIKSQRTKISALRDSMLSSHMFHSDSGGISLHFVPTSSSSLTQYNEPNGILIDSEDPCPDGDCPIDVAIKAAEVQPIASDLVQFERIKDMIALSIGLSFMLYILFRHREFWDFILICVHAFIRSIMDLKYEIAGLEGREKIVTYVKLLLLNFGQLRLLFDIYQAYSIKAVFSLSLMLTQVTDALFKRVPQGAICIRRLYIVFHQDTNPSSLDGIVEILVPLLLLTLCFFLGTRVMHRFEIAMNSRSANVSTKICFFFFFDFSLRVTMFGSAWYFYSNSSHGNSILIFSLLFIYSTKVLLFLYHFINRGYVYESTDPDKPNPTSALWFQIMFSFFPAGFIQSFTEFPFNAELSSKRWLFILHQTLSNCEFITMFVMINWLTDMESIAKSSIVLAFRVLVPIMLIAKAAFFGYYLDAKVPLKRKVEISQSEKMTKMSTTRSAPTMSTTRSAPSMSDIGE